jgi:hypothetical protein
MSVTAARRVKLLMGLVCCGLLVLSATGCRVPNLGDRTSARLSGMVVPGRPAGFLSDAELGILTPDHSADSTRSTVTFVGYLKGPALIDQNRPIAQLNVWQSAERPWSFRIAKCVITSGTAFPQYKPDQIKNGDSLEEAISDFENQPVEVEGVIEDGSLVCSRIRSPDNPPSPLVLPWGSNLLSINLVALPGEAICRAQYFIVDSSTRLQAGAEGPDPRAFAAAVQEAWSPLTTAREGTPTESATVLLTESSGTVYADSIVVGESP